MYIFKKEKRNEILNGRTTRYVASLLDVHEFYLGDILRGKRGCSLRLAKQIIKLVNDDIDILHYFSIKEK